MSPGTSNGGDSHGPLRKDGVILVQGPCESLQLPAEKMRRLEAPRDQLRGARELASESFQRGSTHAQRYDSNGSPLGNVAWLVTLPPTESGRQGLAFGASGRRPRPVTPTTRPRTAASRRCRFPWLLVVTTTRRGLWRPRVVRGGLS